MSQENPYDKFLDGRSLEAILSSTPGAMASALAAMSPEKHSAPIAPGKWSPAQVISHLADCEIAFGWRLRQILAEDLPTLQPFDQDKWAASYGGVTAASALDAFTGLRAWNLQFIKKALPGAAARAGIHPERGRVTFQTTVETMAGHDLNHLGQLTKIAGE
jgi:DinB superfamily